MEPIVPEHQEHHAGVEAGEVTRVVLVLACAAAVWFRLWEPWPRVSLIGLVGTVLGGWPIFAEAWENLRARRMTMELSMTIALVAALVIGEFFTALLITAFVLAAEILEGLPVGRGRRAIKELLAFLPPTATVRRSGGSVEIPLGELRAGDTALIAPGAAVPADGRVISGHSFVDQATITGESLPAEKAPGAPVYAGTINQNGALEVRVERVGADSSFGKIIDAVERAERSRAPVQKIADRYAAWLVYFALGCAALTFLLTRDARATISVIIVAGACGIAAGTPLAILGAIGRAARNGTIVKGGRHLEALWQIDVMAFDKTGTVTTGVPRVCGIHPVPGRSASDVLAAAATAEVRSEHPLGRAIMRRAVEQGMVVEEPERFAYTPGRGVVAGQGGDEIVAGNWSLLASHGIVDGPPPEYPVHEAESEVLVARGGRWIGSVLVADTLRPEAAPALRDLRALGIRTVLLSGDATPVARAVARALSFDDVAGDLLPEQKVEAVRGLARGGQIVAMVGDGVNDAPALAEAAVGIAIGSGTDVARESADVVLLGSDLSKLVESIRIARQARDIIRFNFAGTLLVDAIGVALAAFGYLNPVLAAGIHVSSELAFILNSARLLPSSNSGPG